MRKECAVKKEATKGKEKGKMVKEREGTMRAKKGTEETMKEERDTKMRI